MIDVSGLPIEKKIEVWNEYVDTSWGPVRSRTDFESNNYFYVNRGPHSEFPGGISRSDNMVSHCSHWPIYKPVFKGSRIELVDDDQKVLM